MLLEATATQTIIREISADLETPISVYMKLRGEGASFLLLLGVAMPLKYLAGQPLAVRVVGMAHGVLFLLFLAALWRAADAHGWPRRHVVLGVIASLVPFGTFWFERRLPATAS